MSKTITLVTVLFCCFTAALSQQQVAVNSAPAPEGYDLEVEVVAEDIGVLISPITLQAVDLTGYSCTRLYVTMNNATDFMSSVSGDALNPTYVNTTTSYFHALLGAATPNGINSVLFGARCCVHTSNSGIPLCTEVSPPPPKQVVITKHAKTCFWIVCTCSSML